MRVILSLKRAGELGSSGCEEGKTAGCEWTKEDIVGDKVKLRLSCGCECEYIFVHFCCQSVRV